MLRGMTKAVGRRAADDGGRCRELTAYTGLKGHVSYRCPPDKQATALNVADALLASSLLPQGRARSWLRPEQSKLHGHSPGLRNHFGGCVVDRRVVGKTILIVDEMGGRRGCSDGGVGVSIAVVTMLAKTAARLV
jgi:hypothetical protein